MVDGNSMLVKIIDLGFGSEMKNHKKVSLGTKGYMSPELYT